MIDNFRALQWLDETMNMCDLPVRINETPIVEKLNEITYMYGGADM